MEPELEQLSLFQRFVLIPLIMHIVTIPYYFFDIICFDFRYYFWWQTQISLAADIVCPLCVLLVDPHTKDLNSCTFLILMMSGFICSIISFCIIMIIKPDRYLAAYFMSSMEKHKYNHLYKQLNGSPPSNIYQLNCKYDNIYECNICMQEFNHLKYEDESILHCGHRFHSSCIRNWELIQFENDPYSNNYKCPACTKEYNWKQKYKYDYTIKHK